MFGGTLTYPFFFIAAEEGGLFDFGVSRRCFFIGDFATLGASAFLGFSRELSISRSEFTGDAVDGAFAIAVVCRSGGDACFFSGTVGGDSLTSSISISSSESSTLSADLTLGLTLDSLTWFALFAFVADDFGGLPIGPFSLAVVLLAAVVFAAPAFLPFLPMIRDMASLGVGFPTFTVGCDADRTIDSPPPLFFVEACTGGFAGSVFSAVTVILGGGADFGGSLAGCGTGGFGSTLPLSSGAKIICHSDASLDNRNRLKAALQFAMA